MSLVDSFSIPSSKSELDFFTVPPTQVVIKKGSWEEINPVNPVTNEGPYEFRIPPDPHFLQMSKNYVYMKLSILPKKEIARADGTIPPTPDIAPINLIGKTFFRQVKLFINGKLIHDSGDKYAFRSFLETELNYGLEAKNSHLQSALYIKDIPELYDSEDNQGFKDRVAYFKNNNIVEVLAPLHMDLFMQDRFLLNFTDVRLELNRNSDNFLLQSPNGANNPSLIVHEMKLYIRKAEILDSLGLALEKTLANYTAKYPIRRVIMMNLHISSTSQSTPLNTLFTGQLPRRMIIGCIDADAYRGNIKKTPFNFKSYSITEVKVVSGGATFPAHSLKLDFKNNRYVRAFEQLFEALEISRDNKGNGITRAGFKNGQCLFAFDLTPDEDDSGHFDLIKEGTTSIEISFDEKLPDTGIEVIVYAEFDNILMLDKNRNALYDYNS
jgi:hypothetical protein